MMDWRLIPLFVLFSLGMYAQNGVSLLLEEMPNDSTYTTVADHSSFKPAIRQQTFQIWKKQEELKEKYFFVAPALDVLAGVRPKAMQFRAAAGFHLHSQVGKWFFRMGTLSGFSDHDPLVLHHGMFIFRDHNGAFLDVRGRVSYTANRVFNFQIGLDNHFIGEGSRSLFLSDYGTPSPFGQIRARVWRLEYSVLYQFMREYRGSSFAAKFGTTHHLSVNATKWLNFGIFETVLFQPKDGNFHRGYEAEYLNPIIFLRPGEYALGSSDNVLIGGSFHAKMGKQMIYGQAIIDEFHWNELRNNFFSWTNKIGWQAGFKGRATSSIGNFFYRAEYNAVRPFTYSHISALQVYGNQGEALAHPMGANFHELLSEVKWQKDRFAAQFFVSYIMKGNNSPGNASYGGDIYQPYIERPWDSPFKIGNGNLQSRIHLMANVNYLVFKPMNLHVFMELNVYHDLVFNRTIANPYVGIRSLLWNAYRNY